MRVVSWNVNFPGARRAERLGAVLCDDSPDLALLQEVNPRSAEVLRQAAGVDWIVRADEADAPSTARPPPHT
jgi:exonuclease III